MTEAGDRIASARRWVIKIGSSLLTRDGEGIDRQAIAGWARELAEFREQGRDVTVVSSGAVAEGMARMGLRRRPESLAELQAAAAVGQLGVVQAYREACDAHGLETAQVLLTHEDCARRDRYLNARNTLNALLQRGIVPVVNENDTVATEEIRFGDNDNLAAMTADLVGAEVLVILTDRAGLLEADPAEHPDAALIREAQVDDAALDAIAGGSSGALGRGGMKTKLEAARRAALSGVTTLIASGRKPGLLSALLRGEIDGTVLRPGSKPLSARKRWIAGQVRVQGRLHIDAGAADVLRGGGKSLLPVGVTAVDGRFGRGDLVACIGPDGREIARGLVNYSADQAGRLAGHGSDRISALLGEPGEPELIHRDNLVLCA